MSDLTKIMAIIKGLIANWDDVKKGGQHAVLAYVYLYCLVGTPDNPDDEAKAKEIYDFLGGDAALWPAAE